jgi:hypothetical protein
MRRHRASAPISTRPRTVLVSPDAISTGRPRIPIGVRVLRLAPASWPLTQALPYAGVASERAVDVPPKLAALP